MLFDVSSVRSPGSVGEPSPPPRSCARSVSCIANHTARAPKPSKLLRSKMLLCNMVFQRAYSHVYFFQCACSIRVSFFQRAYSHVYFFQPAYSHVYFYVQTCRAAFTSFSLLTAMHATGNTPSSMTFVFYRVSTCEFSQCH